MAGIGFELRRVVARSDLASSLQAVFSGALLVAGPWLITVLTIFAIHSGFGVLRVPQAPLFQAVVTYSYALSLALGSPVQYLFTRLVSDLIWEKREKEASVWLVAVSLSVFLLFGLMAFAVTTLVPIWGTPNWPLSVSTSLLFAAVNALWVMMLFISLLKRFLAILLVYLGGMAVAIGLTLFGAHHAGPAGAVYGFAVGHLVILLGLGALVLKDFPPRGQTGMFRPLGRLVREYGFLALSGFFFYAGQWVDKFVFWFSRGRPVDGTLLRIWGFWDFPVYLAGLSLIPGLIYFLIFSETTYYTALRKFLHSVSTKPYVHIRQERFHLIRVMNRELLNQMLVQVLAALAFLALFWAIPGLNFWAVTSAVAGGWFLLLLMTLLNYQYYLEFYRQAAWSAGVFFVFQGVGAAMGLAFPGLFPGLGFLMAIALACLVAFMSLERGVRSMERNIFLKAVGRR